MADILRLNRRSLTLRLLAGVAAPFLLFIVLAGTIAYLSAIDEISEVYDSQLITSAQQLWRLARAEDDWLDVEIGQRDPHLDPANQAVLDDYGRRRAFRVWRDGHPLLTSDGAPFVMTTDLAKDFHTVRTDIGDWRLFVFQAPETRMVVVVGESLAVRREVSARIVWGLTLPLLLVLPLVLVMVWLAIRWGLGDLRRFAGDIARRSPDDLSHVSRQGLPIEIAPVAEAVDHLLDKLSRSLSQERLFTDNAAHELRTPLAALVVQADVIRNAVNEDERRMMVDELRHGAGRAGRLLDQLLVLARLRHMPVEAMALNLYNLAGEVIKDHYGRARERNIELSLDGDEDAGLVSSRPLIALLAGNVIDNAIKYSPPGSAVEVRVERRNGKAALIVTDAGPGIPDAEREQVFARFYRLKGHAESGSGLGLAIVKTLAELLCAQVGLETAPGGRGLRVTVGFS